MKRKLIFLIVLITAFASRSQATVTITWACQSSGMPAIIDFAATSSLGTAISYLWNFGDGTGFTTSATPTHTYSAPGVYTVFVSLSTSTGLSDSGYIQILAPCVTGGTISYLHGTIYNDSNANCVYDAGELTFSAMPVHIVSSGGSIDFQVFANYTGIYHVAVPGDSTYTITPLYPGNILPACPASGSATTTVPGDSTQTLNFSYTCTGDSMDLAIAGHTIWFYSTSYSPCSTGPVDMTVTIPNGASYDSNSAYAAIYQQPDTVIGNQLFWHLQDFANFSTVIGLVADTSIIHPGDIICTTMHITALPGEADTANNTYTFCTPWTGSFDPNDKMALPAGAGPESYIPAATPAFTYLINFQNTGTDTATSVILRDTLSSYFDAASLQLIGASHPVALSQQGNTLAFSFPGIQLPDSNASEPESHGYVMYSVRMQDSVPPGTSITNSASIYFDGNTPVVTNTTINTIEFPASTATGLLHPAPAIAIYPNPASGVFSINMPDDFENWYLTVSDIRGTSILTMPTLTQQHLYIRLQAAPGLYFVRLRNERSGAVVIKKMILSP